MPRKLFVANWKMAKSYSESIIWLHENKLNLFGLSKKTGYEIALCPSFESLESAVKIFEESPIKIGAQNCASFNLGSYTGEVSAVSLKEMGVDYCIVGHSERRQIFGETSFDVAQKAKLLFANNIKPIICVGETQEEKEDGLSFEIISQQLDPIMEIIATLSLDTITYGDHSGRADNSTSSARGFGDFKNKKTGESIKELIIAYEPIWAIGTGITPDNIYLNKIITWLEAYFKVAVPGLKTKILYGGSIDSETVKRISKVDSLSGFLVGRSSLDFQTIEKIVLSI